MGNLNLNGNLNLTGNLILNGRNGGKVTVSSLEVVVEVIKGQGSGHGVAMYPVPIPPPPLAPIDPTGLAVWIITSFNQSVKAKNKNIVTQGMCVQGIGWPGLIQQSTINVGVTINHIPINVKGDIGVTLPSGAVIKINASGQ